MTIKELCKKHINCAVCPYLPICGDRPENYSLGNDLEVTNAIIETAKELEQEPSEDCVSRKFMYELGATCIATRDKNNKLIALGTIENLPPVTPMPKTGHWIYDKRIENWKCSECGCSPKTIGYVGRAEFMREHFKFCNHCGAKMIEPQVESE